jgi:levanase/fructan beta-fructosidase
MKNLIFVLSVLFVFIGCNQTPKNKQDTSKNVDNIQSEEELYRPNFHFTPKTGWMNDPNGMFFYNGYYHLFFQHYPDDNVWGPMNWGHAISTDMVQWQELPIALEPDEKGYIFSGSAVVDMENTSGFGDGSTPPVVAMFTYHDPKGEKEGRQDYQTQAIAYSLNEGKTWTKYEGNPVIDNPGIKDFRDPKITWDMEHKKWLMVLASGDKTMFYGSENLKDWDLLSEFGKGIGAHGGVWECPDFFPIQVENSEKVKWVLIQSLNPGGYNGGSGTQYFVGDFDGKKFKLDPSMENLPEKHKYWIDYGKDNYAGVTWSNIPDSDGRALFMGWMSNWLYGQKVPTETWRSAMTVARELKLKKVGDSYRVYSLPVKELGNYISKTFDKELIEVENTMKIATSAEIDLAKAIIKYEFALSQNENYEFSLSNQKGDTLKFGFDKSKNQFYIDRKKSGITSFNNDFANKVSTAPRTSISEKISVQIVLDKTSIELFFDNGETVMTEIFFPNAPFESFSAGGDKKFKIENLQINQLKFN